MGTSLKSPEEPAAETTGLLPKSNHEQPANLTEVERVFPRQSWAFRVFKIISSLAILISAVMLAVQVAAVVVFDLWLIPNILRLYISAFCIILILTELRVEKFGFLYSFIGLIGVVMAMANEMEVLPVTLETRQMIVHLVMLGASYCMFGLGLLYMLMGICCLHGVWERMKAGYDAEMDRATLEGPNVDVR